MALQVPLMIIQWRGVSVLLDVSAEVWAMVMALMGSVQVQQSLDALKLFHVHARWRIGAPRV
jgi:hypothetical protein